MRTKHYAFAAASVVLLVLVLATPSLAAQGNNKPCLCYPTITPQTGTAKNVYVASVMYSDPDGDVAAKVEVYIDNVPYPMKRLGKGSAAKATYRARLTLPSGEHTYYFYAEDARGANERFPRYGAYAGPFVGTKKTVYNRLPSLTDGGVYYERGTDHDIYTYKVHYQDPDGCKPPRVVRVFVDGVCHDMQLYTHDPVYNQASCGSPASNASRYNGTYTYQTMLPPGPHAYYFVVKDGNGDCVTLPSAGFLRGPWVMTVPNSAPALIDHRLEPAVGGVTDLAGFQTRYHFLVHYNDVDFDAPRVALVYIDNVPHAMKRVQGKPANGLYGFTSGEFLSNMHTYYYYFEDGKGASVRLPDVGVYHGPVVTR